jgi:Tol biopolymer transport system component
MDADGKNQHLLATSGGRDFSPRWSPDGKQILFQGVVTSGCGGSGCSGPVMTYLVNADGSNLRRLDWLRMAMDSPMWRIP